MFYYIAFLGTGYWKSAYFIGYGIILTVLILRFTYRSVSRVWFKRVCSFLIICALLIMPTYTLVSVTSTHSTAISITNEETLNYFKDKLERSYNYTELIIWENQHLNFTKGNIDRNTDPIKIYEYGKGRCQEFSILYATLCISQGYRCRIVDSIFNDHSFNEVLESNGTWVRVDPSLNPEGIGAVGNPLFFEESKGWMPPILSLAYENSTITEVTSTYRSDGFEMLSPTTVMVLIVLMVFSLVTIRNELILLPKTKPEEDSSQEEEKVISEEEEKERDKLIYEIVVKRHDQELQRKNDLDTKANNIIGFSGILAALIATVVSYLPKGNYTLLFAVPLFLLILSAILGLLAYRVKTYETIQPSELIEAYCDKSFKKTLKEYTGTLAKTTLNNHLVHENKAKLTKYATELLVLAISLFFVIAISNWLI